MFGTVWSLVGNVTQGLGIDVLGGYCRDLAWRHRSGMGELDEGPVDTRDLFLCLTKRVKSDSSSESYLDSHNNLAEAQCLMESVALTCGLLWHFQC